MPHLLSDIAAAHREGGAREEITEHSFEEHIEEVERFISGEAPDHTFGYYCGLGTMDFPPPEQFTKEEITQVYQAFEKLLYSWNASIELSEKLPLHLRYKFMVATLAEDFTVLNSGMTHFDYCTGYAPDCDFKEYWPCLEFWKERPDEDISTGAQEDELPL